MLKSRAESTKLKTGKSWWDPRTGVPTYPQPVPGVSAGVGADERGVHTALCSCPD